MTLGELKDMINDLEASYGEEVLEKTVMGEYDYGDISHTRALTNFSYAEVITPRESAYSRTGLAVPIDDEDYDNDNDDADEIVALLL